LGIEVTGLVAGLGVSGVAVAFAAQAILKDVFSYFSIFLDKPFEIGDFIILDSFMGTVEHIGIKTTKVRSLGGEQLIFANADLTNARVRNFKRMWERRVVFRFGLLYETPAAQLREVPSIVRQIIESLYQSKFDRCHFFQFGDYSLIFETVYYVSSNDYNTYMDIQHEINLKLKEALEERGMGFAYPTQSVYLHSTE
jgi:small-conductance mechanosensitive channel